MTALTGLFGVRGAGDVGYMFAGLFVTGLVLVLLVSMVFGCVRAARVGRGGRR